MTLVVPVEEIVANSGDPMLSAHTSWCRVSLSQVADVLNGFAFKSRFFNNVEGVPLLRIRDVGENRIETRYAGSYDEEYVVRSGDLVVGMDGDFKCSRWKGPDALLNQRVCKVTATTELFDDRFLEHALPGYLDAINRNTSSQTVKHLSSRDVERIPLPLPPLNEQHRIVAKIEQLFSKLDAGVAALQRAKALLKRYRQSVLKAAVTGELTRAWRESHRDQLESADRLLKRILAERRRKWEEAELAKLKAKGKTPTDDCWKAKYKEPQPPKTEGLPELPEGWCWAALPQLGELNRGKSKHRPRNHPKLYGGPYPFIQTGDVRAANGILRTHSQTYSELGLAQSRLWPAGTMCITIAANIAETAILGFDSCFPDSIVGFLPDDSHCNVRFVELFLRVAKQDLARYAPATAQKNINLEILADLAVPLPPLEEQRQIFFEADAQLSVADTVQSALESQTTKATVLRQSVLRSAFRGQLVPQDPTDEPAMVLLERVEAERGQGRRPPTKRTRRVSA